MVVAAATPPAGSAAAEVKTHAAGEAAPEAVAAQPQAAGDAPAYTPPFPDRVDLFTPPKRQGGAAIAKVGGENAVELMGFVRVDRPRAVLAINGEITTMAEGETQFGIEVISVHSPNVVLQRGRQRWQATLE